jgi:hypothetical protein
MKKDAGKRPLGTRATVLALTSAALIAGGIACAFAALADDAPRAGVTVHEAGPPPTRAEMIRDWRTLLTQHGQRLPDTSSMTTEEIRQSWDTARTRYAEPDDAMSVSVCEISLAHQLFDPDCW